MSEGVGGFCYAEIRPDGTYGVPLPFLAPEELNLVVDTKDEDGVVHRRTGQLEGLTRSVDGSVELVLKSWSHQIMVPYHVWHPVRKMVWELRKRGKAGHRNRRRG